MMIRIGRWNIQFGSLLVIVLLGFISTCFIFQVLLLSAFYSSHIVSHTNIQIFDQSFCSASSFARIDYFKMSGEKITISMSIKHKILKYYFYFLKIKSDFELSLTYVMRILMQGVAE